MTLEEQKRYIIKAYSDSLKTMSENGIDCSSEISSDLCLALNLEIISYPMFLLMNRLAFKLFCALEDQDKIIYESWD